MSGGSYDYFYHKVEDFADSLRKSERDPRRASFQKLMRLIAKACHDIEWVDSYDYGEGDEHDAIDAVFAFLGACPEIIKQAHAYEVLRDKLRDYLK